MVEKRAAVALGPETWKKDGTLCLQAYPFIPFDRESRGVLFARLVQLGGIEQPLMAHLKHISTKAQRVALTLV